MCSTLGDQEWAGQCSRMTVQHLESRHHLYTTGTLVGGSHQLQVRFTASNNGFVVLSGAWTIIGLVSMRSWSTVHWNVLQYMNECNHLGKQICHGLIHTWLFTVASSVSSPSTVAVETLEQINTDSTMLTRICFTFIINCSERCVAWMKNEAVWLTKWRKKLAA